MQLKSPFVFIFFGLFAISTVSAQSSASLEAPSADYSHSNQITIGNEDWTFYHDSDSKVYYIDFESISVNLSDLKVIDEEGGVVMADKLWDLPVNTIYELDLKGLKPGNYKIELRSYTGVIEKEVSVSE